jgi:hypothetical protein
MNKGSDGCSVCITGFLDVNNPVPFIDLEDYLHPTALGSGSLIGLPGTSCQIGLSPGICAVTDKRSIFRFFDNSVLVNPIRSVNSKAIASCCSPFVQVFLSQFINTVRTPSRRRCKALERVFLICGGQGIINFILAVFKIVAIGEIIESIFGGYTADNFVQRTANMSVPILIVQITILRLDLRCEQCLNCAS